MEVTETGPSSLYKQVENQHPRPAAALGSVLQEHTIHAGFSKETKRNQVGWHIPVIPATLLEKYRSGGSQFTVSPGKKLARAHLNQQAGHGRMYL
jgi:hypothetical protein